MTKEFRSTYALDAQYLEYGEPERREILFRHLKEKYRKMDLKVKADQRRVAAGAKASSGRAHQQTPTRTDIQAPEGRKRPQTNTEDSK